MSENDPDLTRNILGVLIVAGLIAASFWILRPFLPAAIWATMIVVFTWPIMIRLQGWLWHRRAPAVVIMSLLLLMIFVLPFAFAAGTIIVNTDRFVGLGAVPRELQPAAPARLAGGTSPHRSEGKRAVGRRHRLPPRRTAGTPRPLCRRGDPLVPRPGRQPRQSCSCNSC